MRGEMGSHGPPQAPIFSGHFDRARYKGWLRALPARRPPRRRGTIDKSAIYAADRAQRARGRLPRSTAAEDDTLRNRIEPMEEKGAVGESEEEEEGAVVDVGVSDSEEELEVLQQPNLIQKLADVVTQRASRVTESLREELR